MTFDTRTNAVTWFTFSDDLAKKLEEFERNAKFYKGKIISTIALIFTLIIYLKLIVTLELTVKQLKYDYNLTTA